MAKKVDFSTIKVASVLTNRYLLTALLGLVWVTFVSEIDLIYLAKSQMELNRLKRQVDHYNQEILHTRTQLEDLSSNPERLERFAREKYFMKRDNEDLFRIVPASPAQKGK